MSDTRERLRASLAADSDTNRPPPWLPEEGDELMGRFVGWSEGEARGESKRIAIIEDDETGERVSVWLLYRVLADELEGAKPEVGDTILIRRLSDRMSQRGQPYRKYEIALERAA